MRSWKRVFWILTLSLSVATVAMAQDKKPNILIIWGDDIGYWNISAYNQGMMGYKTPNIDRIAKEGMLLDDLGFENRRYKFMEVYGHSKLANILHARELNARYGHQGISAAAIHPGVVRTGFGEGTSRVVRFANIFGGRWMASAEDGADTIVWLATEPSIDTTDGIYFENRKPSKSTRHAKDAIQAQRLWDTSKRLTQSNLSNPR